MIFKEKFLVFQDECCCILGNIFGRCEACLVAGSQYFEAHV